MFDFGRNAWRKSPRKRRITLKMAILTKKSKIFIKAKLTVSKSYLLGLIYLMIWCILRDAILQKVVYFKNESGTGVVFLALCMYLMVIIDNSLLFCLYIFVLEDLAFFPTVGWWLLTCLKFIANSSITHNFVHHCLRSTSPMCLNQRLGQKPEIALSTMTIWKLL